MFSFYAQSQPNHGSCAIFSIQNEETYGIVSVPLTQQALISTFEDPQCFSSMMLNSSLVIDSGASVCISPHKSDVITYNKCKMKIKDQSSSNHVAGKGIVCWSVKDANDSPIQVELMGYHMPKADVRLLSPQVLIKTVGGQSLQTNKGINITLDKGVNFFAQYCPHSNLPQVPLALPNEEPHCFWSTAFGISASDFKRINAIKSTLFRENTNLSQPRKEILLWHQRLSHASILWIQSLMREKKFLPCIGHDSAFHIGPLIMTNSQAPTCDTSTLKCAACLYAKASVQTPSNLPPRQSLKNMTLKIDDLKPGDCISADHYFSPFKGRSPHSFGKE
jgi:hypothetical protein